MARSAPYLGKLAHTGRHPIICAARIGRLGKCRNGTSLCASIRKSLGGLCQQTHLTDKSATPTTLNLINTPMAHIITLEFIETQTFTRSVNALLSEEEQRKLQNELLANPERGTRKHHPGRGRHPQGAICNPRRREKRRYEGNFLLGEIEGSGLHVTNLTKIAPEQLDRRANGYPA